MDSKTNQTKLVNGCGTQYNLFDKGYRLALSP